MRSRIKSMFGMSFIEFIVFFGIIAGIVSGGMYYFGVIGPYAKLNNLLEKIRAVNAAVLSVHSESGGSYASLTTDALESSLPTDTLITAWGSRITLAGISSDSFTVNIPMMPASLCTLLMTNLSAGSNYDLSSTECPEDKDATVSFTYTYNINQN